MKADDRTARARQQAEAPKQSRGGAGFTFAELFLGDALVVETPPNQIMGFTNLCLPWLVVNYELAYTKDDWGGQCEAGMAWEERRHNWRWKVAFCGGQTESQRTRELFDGARGGGVGRWNRDNQRHPENLGLYRH
jgi:hypothetical protein